MARQRSKGADHDVPLARYQSMRDFQHTPEPAGAPAPDPGSGQRRFVVQRHRARALHYDVRFEIDGVLVSWAVPKGPSLDPDVRRLAVHVEDHPVEYLDFEGVIPGGQYGGGDVIVWDTGTWEPNPGVDPAEELAGGTLHATVHGQKLQGRFVLFRTSREGSGGKEQWMMVHKRDDHTVAGWDAEDHPHSVLSGRTNDEVKHDPDRLWRSDLPADQASVALKVAVPDPVTEDELAALDELGQNGRWTVFGRTLRVTNLDKELFGARDGQPPVTKRDLIRYAAQVGPTLLPYLAGRALNMHRYPGGADTKGFWHKELPDHAPDWVPRWRNPDAGRGETRTYLVVDEAAALVWAANFGALEWHPWTSRTEQPRCPSYVLFDIDPGERTSWEEVLVLARLHRTALEHLGMRGRPKLTGRRGIQVWVPIAEGPGFDQTRAWAETVSRSVGTVVPELVSWKWSVQERRGLARLDYTQNAINKTLVAPYSPRPAPGAPVSAPIDWDDLDDPDLRPDGVTLRDMPGRLAERGDLFADVLDHHQTLPDLH
ncbi:non-homologous end-joining DNA ligase LigD [Desertihabitans aurantiacus]|uniref:non-homologous end-joining DNA ligase LigD n=1 Tax=Desertihabitans aurantiacus TaxID=2282477 RepID=UPI000DF8489A|nr:DNA polymerase ligase N-terminal domain-containing protein [Desertihabitans aurantiacus]